MQGPFEIEIKTHLRVGDNSAVVTYTLPVGIYPTREAVEKAVAASLESAQEQFGKDEVRLLTRPEFQNSMLAEKIGQYIEFASPDAWDE